MKTPKANNQKVYLTFKTDAQISILLKDIANKRGKTQPELIEEICNDYVKNFLLDILEQKITENKAK